MLHIPALINPSKSCLQKGLGHSPLKGIFPAGTTDGVLDNSFSPWHGALHNELWLETEIFPTFEPPPKYWFVEMNHHFQVAKKMCVHVNERKREIKCSE